MDLGSIGICLGVGVSHHPAVTEAGMAYERPLDRTRAYLDALDAAAPPVARRELVLTALGPRMLELARDRTAGAHPFLVTPDRQLLLRQTGAALQHVRRRER